MIADLILLIIQVLTVVSIVSGSCRQKLYDILTNL